MLVGRRTEAGIRLIESPMIVKRLRDSLSNKNNMRIQDSEGYIQVAPRPKSKENHGRAQVQEHVEA